MQFVTGCCLTKAKRHFICTTIYVFTRTRSSTMKMGELIRQEIRRLLGSNVIAVVVQLL